MVHLSTVHRLVRLSTVAGMIGAGFLFLALLAFLAHVAFITGLPS